MPSASDYFSDYDAEAKALRTWFVAYGIGGPVLLLTNESLRAKLVASGESRQIAAAFLIGVGLQIVLTLAMKHALWECYLQPSADSSLAHRFVDRWIFDLAGDVISLVAFLWATYRTFMILTA